MPSEKTIQQQAELSDTNDKLIPQQQRRDVRSQSESKENKNKNNIARNTAVLGEEGKTSKSGLVEMSERSKRARSSG